MRRERRLVLVAVALGSVAALGLVGAAGAATMAASSVTPSTTAPPASVVATTVPTSSTTTTTDPGSGSGGAGPSGQAAGGSPPAGAQPASAGGGQSAAVDYRMLAESQGVARTGPSSTAPLLAALGQLGRFGLTPVQQAVIGMGRFPVAGLASYRDDFLEYRSFPQPHLHQGIDIVAAQGTPLRSPTDGVLLYSTADPDGYGLTAVVEQADRTYFLLAHMSATVLGLSSGATIKQGQVIGFVGATGDATGPHCHFEIHVRGGPAIDPKPFLDGSLNQAMSQVPALVQAFDGTRQMAAPVVAPLPLPAPRAQALSLAPVPAASPRRSSSGVLIRALGLVVALVAAGAVWDVVDRRRLTGPR